MILRRTVKVENRTQLRFLLHYLRLIIELGILFILLLIFSFCIFLLFLFLTDYYILSSFTESVVKEHFHVKYSRLNIETCEFSSGISTVIKELKNDEFLSYQNYLGDHFIISNFESIQYACYGTCYCSEKEEGVGKSYLRKSFVSAARSSTRAVSKSFLYLFAALTSSLAYNLAENYFREECEKIGCESPSEIVSSEVNVCAEENDVPDFLKEMKKRFEELEEEEGGQDEHIWGGIGRNLEEKRIYGGRGEELPSVEKITFECIGNCLPFNKRISSEYSDSEVDNHIEMSKKFGCEKLELVERFDVWMKREDNNYGPFQSENIKDKKTSGTRMEIPKFNFINNHLNNFCSENSQVPFGKDGEEKSWACEGFKFVDNEQEEMDNESVKCIEVHKK